MHQILTQMYLTVSIGPSHMESSTGFSRDFLQTKIQFLVMAPFFFRTGVENPYMYMQFQ